MADEKVTEPVLEEKKVESSDEAPATEPTSTEENEGDAGYVQSGLPSPPFRVRQRGK